MGYLETLQTKTKDELVNTVYNGFVSSLADYEDGDTRGQSTGGKRIPYIGWFWRFCDFVEKSISIGDCGSFIGVMENNKWDYPQRLMTEEEVNTFIGYLDRAHAELNKGGNVAETHGKAEKVFVECWDWFQTLKI